jgi:holo-[acyl-carrier protein] synthase
MNAVPLAVGVDLVEIPRIARAVVRWGDRFLELAVRFAAKEAVSKALGVGIWWRGGIAFAEAEVRPNRLGKPEIRLHGRAAEYAREQGLDEWTVSLSHTNEHAIAMVVAMRSR